MAANVYVYEGPGADEQDVQVIINAVMKSVKPGLYNVTSITPDTILKGTWVENAAAFVMPGGFDRGFIRALGDTGAEIIRQYVWNGGSYLGVGAGGYYACDYIEFDMGGPLQVEGPRPLKFFPGKGIGPAYGPYSYDDERGARAAPVDFYDYPGPRSISSKIYFNGGCLFLPYDKDAAPQEVENEGNIPMGTMDKVLGLFSGLPNKPISVVKCTAGKGVAVLSGVQLEVRSTDLDGTDPYLKPIKEQLQSDDVTDSIIWSLSLQELGLSVVV